MHVTAVGVNKVYDGTPAASVTFSTDALTGDQVVAAGAASFADKNVGTGKAVSVTGITISGADAGNYTLFNTTASTSALCRRRDDVVRTTAKAGCDPFLVAFPPAACSRGTAAAAR